MSSQQTDNVAGEEYSSGEQIAKAPVSIGGVILALVLTALMLAGFYVMGIAFGAAPGMELWTFLGGLLLTSLPFFVVFTVLSDGSSS